MYAFNQIHVPDTPHAQELLDAQIGAAEQIISDYVGFDCEEVFKPYSMYTPAARALFKLTCARITTLLQQENGANIGVNTAASDMSVSRTWLNTTDYTQYLKQLSSFRRNSGVF